MSFDAGLNIMLKNTKVQDHILVLSAYGCDVSLDRIDLHGAD